MKYSIISISILLVAQNVLCSDYPTSRPPMNNKELAMYNLLSTTQQHYQSSIPVSLEFNPWMGPNEYRQLILHRQHLPQEERLRLAQEDQEKLRQHEQSMQQNLAEKSEEIIRLGQEINDWATQHRLSPTRRSFKYIPKKPKRSVLMIFCCCSNNNKHKKVLD